MTVRILVATTVIGLTGWLLTPAVNATDPTTGATAVHAQLAASADDAFTVQGGLSSYTAAVGAVFAAPVPEFRVASGLRFTGIDIPQGARIISANVSLTSLDASYADIDATVFAQAADDAADFSTDPDLFSEVQRPRSTASVDWDDPTASDVINSPNLAPVVQEVVDRPGWQSGNALNLVLEGDDSPEVSAMIFEAFDGPEPDKAAQFTVFYTLAAGPSETSAALTSSADDVSATPSGPLDLDSPWNITVASPQPQARVANGLRFDGIAVPPGATILSASVSLPGLAAGWANMDAVVVGEATDDATDFTSDADLFSEAARPRTVARSAWKESLEVGAPNASPDIGPIVQEIVNRAGWSSGNALALMLLPPVGPIKAAVFPSFDANPALAPALSITYTTDSGVHFADVTDEVGLDTTNVVSLISLCNVDCGLVNKSGAAAIADYDNDADLDVYMSRLGGTDVLFCNQLAQTGAPVFEDCTAGTGLDAYVLDSNAAAWADIDADGDQDLYVATFESRYYLFVNDGSGHFTEEAVARGADLAITGNHVGNSVTFGDYDLDGYVDIHTTEHREGSAESTEYRSRLLHNLGEAAPGVYEDVTDAAGVRVHFPPPCAPSGLCGEWAFSSAFVDLDGDQYPDLAVVSDFGHSRIFWNDQDGTFTDGTDAAGVATDENGMGTTFGDYDGDGDYDWFVTSIFSTGPPSGEYGVSGNRLYRTDPGRTFTDVTDDAGVRDGAWGWGTSFLDYDNDGDMDLVMTNGTTAPGFTHDPMRFWENDGTGTFIEKAPVVGLSDVEHGHALHTFDYDDDGDLDILIAHTNGPPILYRNVGGNTNDWLRVRVVGTDSSLDVHGALVIAYDVGGRPFQVREIGTGSEYLGHGEHTAHFGLGSHVGDVSAVEVRWPNGETSVYPNVAKNSTLVAIEPAAT